MKLAKQYLRSKGLTRVRFFLIKCVTHHDIISLKPLPLSLNCSVIEVFSVQPMHLYFQSSILFSQQFTVAIFVLLQLIESFIQGSDAPLHFSKAASAESGSKETEVPTEMEEPSQEKVSSVGISKEESLQEESSEVDVNPPATV